MANEFVARLGLVALDSSRITGSLNVSANVVATSFTGSLFGTASYVTGALFTSVNPALSASYALSSSFALSASFASNGGVTSVAGTANEVLINGGTTAVAGAVTVSLPTTVNLGAGSSLTATSLTGSISSSNLQGAISNAQLQNSSVTVGTTAISLGASSTTLAGLTSVSSTSLTGSITASSLQGAIANAQLQNSTVTVGNTSIALGATATTITGLTSLTSTSLTGSLLGTASYVTGALFTSTNPALSSSFALTASFALNSGGATSITVADESAAQGTATFINFTGAGVTATVSSNTASINIPGGSGDTFPYTGSAIISGSLQVTGSIRSTQGFTGSLFGTASLAATASFYEIVTGSAGNNFSVTASLSGSIINIPTASANSNGLLTSQSQTIGGAKTFSGGISIPDTGGDLNFSIPLLNTTNTTSNIVYTGILGATSTQIRVGLGGGGSTNTILNNSNYFSVVIGSNTPNMSLGNNTGSLYSVLGVRSFRGTPSATSYIKNSATLYIEGQSLFAVENNYSLWIDSGSTRLDGDLIMSQSNIIVTGSVNASAGFTGSLFGTASYVTGSVFSSANPALSASYALTASFAANGGVTTVAGTADEILINGGTAAAAGAITVSLPSTVNLGAASSFTATSLTGSITASSLQGAITNAQLSNSSVTIGSTAISLGATSTTLSGLSSVSSTSLTGSITASSLQGAILNSQLQNSTISGRSLGTNLLDLTAGTGVSYDAGTTYNGGTARTVSVAGASTLTTNKVVKWNGSAFADSNIFDNGTSVFVTASTVIVSGASSALIVTGSISVTGSANNFIAHNLGIGTLSTERLTVRGTSGNSTVVGIERPTNVATSEAQIAFRLYDSSNSPVNYGGVGGYIVSNTLGVESGGTKLYYNSNGAGLAAGLTLDNAGRVAINKATATSTLDVNGNTIVTGSLRVTEGITGSSALFTNTITAQTLVVQTVTSSVAFVTGSTQFGSQSTNTHQFTGSVNISGSLRVTGQANIVNLTGSLFGTASYVTGALFTSTNPALSASYAFTASYALNSASPSVMTAVSSSGSTIYSLTPAAGPNFNTTNSVFLGSEAGNNSIDSSGSIFIGYQAGSSSYSSSNCIFLGYQAGAEVSLTSGRRNNNIFLGFRAGWGIITNTYESTFIGYEAGAGASSPQSNFIGFSAGGAATSSPGCNFIGYYAGWDADAVSGGNFIGYEAGYNLDNSDYSNVIGYRAGKTSVSSISIGRNNIIIGTGVTLPSGSIDSINIGGLIYGTGSVYNLTGGQSGSSNGRIGINQPNPQYSLDISGSAYASSGFTGSLFGTSSWALNVVGGASSFPFTGSANITGSLNVIGPATITGSLVVSGSSVGIVASSGIGAAIPALTASEALAAGDFVNIATGGVRKASVEVQTRQAHGFVNAAYSANNPVVIYQSGINGFVTGLTAGARYFLSASGTESTTAPTRTGSISQEVGVAISSTALLVNIGPPILT